jgi:hypothetical protein
VDVWALRAAVIAAGGIDGDHRARGALVLEGVEADLVVAAVEVEVAPAAGELERVAGDLAVVRAELEGEAAGVGEAEAADGDVGGGGAQVEAARAGEGGAAHRLGGDDDGRLGGAGDPDVDGAGAGVAAGGDGDGVARPGLVDGGLQLGDRRHPARGRAGAAGQGGQRAQREQAAARERKSWSRHTILLAVWGESVSWAEGGFRPRPVFSPSTRSPRRGRHPPDGAGAGAAGRWRRRRSARRARSRPLARIR